MKLITKGTYKGLYEENGNIFKADRLGQKRVMIATTPANKKSRKK